MIGLLERFFFFFVLLIMWSMTCNEIQITKTEKLYFHNFLHSSINDRQNESSKNMFYWLSCAQEREFQEYSSLRLKKSVLNYSALTLGSFSDIQMKQSNNIHEMTFNVHKFLVDTIT